MRSRLAFVALCAALLAGCGGGGGSKPAASGAASIVPDTASALVAVDSNLDSASWKKAESLLDRFPGKDDVLTSLRSSLQKNGLNWERDVKPALGAEIDFVWLDFDSSKHLVGITKPKDVDKFNALLEQGSSPSVHEQVEGWTVFANDQTQLDRFNQLRDSNSGRLDGDSAYTDSLDGLPSDAIATAFVRGSAIQSRIDQAIEQSGGPTGTTADQIGKLDAFGAAVTPESSGIRIDSALHGDLKLGGGYHADLPSSLPAGPLFYLSFNNIGGRLNTLLDDYARANPSFDQQRAQVEAALGLTFKDVFDLLGGEGAFALYRTTGTPALLFVVQVSDESKARSLVEKLAALAQLSNSSNVSVRSVQIGGVQAREFSTSRYSIFAAAFDGKLVVTNSRASIETMQGTSSKLADDPAYKAAVSGAGMPSETNGFLYASLSGALDYAFSYAESHGRTIPQVAKENTAPLRGLLLYANKSGNKFQFTGFLGIE